MRTLSPTSFAFALLFAVLVAPSAQAQWTLCNQTSFVLESAIAYDESGRRITEGWTRLRPGECREVIDRPLTPGMHYLYARSSFAHRGGRREWSGYADHCVDVSDFSLAGEAECEEVGFETRGFVEIDITSEEQRTPLREPTSYEDPHTAGVQRLLRDNGYEIRTIDGFSGRRTRRAVRVFAQDQGIDASLDEPELIDALEEAALSRADEIGLRLCNRAEGSVWAAVARRRDDSWESRGWWPLDPGECARVFDEPLEDPAYYVYAGRRENGVDRPLTAADETFCIAETRFDILGRENCVSRGFIDARFATVLSQGREAVSLEFTEADFNDAPDEAE